MTTLTDYCSNQHCHQLEKAFAEISAIDKYTIIQVIAALNAAIIASESDYNDEPYTCSDFAQFTIKNNVQESIWHILDKNEIIQNIIRDNQKPIGGVPELIIIESLVNNHDFTIIGAMNALQQAQRGTAISVRNKKYYLGS